MGKNEVKKMLPWYLINSWLWLVVLIMVWKIDPDIIRDVWVERLYLPFIGLVSGATCLTVYLWRKSLFKAVVWGGLIGLALGLRVLTIGHWVNLALIVGLLLTMEYYWSTTKN